MVRELRRPGVSTSLTAEHMLAVRKSQIEYLELGVEEQDVEGESKFDKIDSMKSFLEGSSKKLWSLHAPYISTDISSVNEQERVDSVRRVKETSDVLARLGGEILVVHPSSARKYSGPITEDIRPTRLEKCKISLKEILDVCKRRRIKLAVENLLGTSLGNSSAEILSLLEGLDPEIAGVCLDTNHMNLKEDLGEAVHRIGERLFTLHVSDNDGREEKHWFPFEGVIEWKPFLEALVNCRYDGVFMYEVIDPSMNAYEKLLKVERNFARMQALLG